VRGWITGSAWSVCGWQHPVCDPMPRVPRLGQNAPGTRAQRLLPVLARAVSKKRRRCVFGRTSSPAGLNQPISSHLAPPPRNWPASLVNFCAISSCCFADGSCCPSEGSSLRFQASASQNQNLPGSSPFSIVTIMRHVPPSHQRFSCGQATHRGGVLCPFLVYSR